MTLKEQYLFHQIHPLKLLTDWARGLIALYLLWRHELAVALVIMLIPPPVASWLVMRFANLKRQRQSVFGRYVARDAPMALARSLMNGYHPSWRIRYPLRQSSCRKCSDPDNKT